MSDNKIPSDECYSCRGTWKVVGWGEFDGKECPCRKCFGSGCDEDATHYDDDGVALCNRCDEDGDGPRFWETILGRLYSAVFTKMGKRATKKIGTDKKDR